MAAPGRLIGSGRYADVYDIGRGRVVRRYRRPGMAVDHEAQVMAHARRTACRSLRSSTHPAATS
jgi:hypothetical protein